MSDTNKQAAFVRTEMLPEQAPPITAAGPVKWMRENLFSSVWNALMTLASIYAVYWILSHILGWLFLSVWDAGSLSECRTVIAAFGREGGACWAVIEDRWLQLMFGFYPADQYWRPILAVVLMFVALAPILFSQFVSSKMMAFSAVYPFIAIWLIWGGSFWTPLMMIFGFVVGAAAFMALSRVTIGGFAVAGAVVAASLWWIFGWGMADTALNRMIGEPRYESRLAEAVMLQETLPAELEAAEAARDAIEDDIAAVIAERDVVAADLELIWAQRTVDDMKPRLEAAAAELAAIADAESDEAAELRVQVGRMEQALADAEATLDAAGGAIPSDDLLDGLQSELLAFQDQLAAMRDDMNLRSGALNRETDRLAAATRTIAILETLRQDQANLPDLRAAASDDNLDAEALAEAQAALQSAERRIDDTYANLGLTGLDYVESRAIGGFMLAIIIGVAGIVLSFPIGIALALGRQSDLVIIKMFCVAFIETIRGVPLIVWLFTAQLLLNYFLPPGTTFDLLLRVVIMVTLFASAYIAEVIRGGLAALPRGQYEGADSLGLDYWQSMRLIILPQTLKISIPGIVNTFIGLFKDTTLVVFIGLFDTIGLINGIRSDTDWNGVYWELFIFVGVLFFISCFSMSKYSQYLERKLATGHR